MKGDIVWFRQLAAPGVEYHWRVGKGAPKRFELVIRSVADSRLEVIREAADVNTAPVTFYLQDAMTEFARTIEKRLLDERRRRHDQIAAREAAEQRAVSEGAERQPEGQTEGDALKNDEVSAGDDKSSAGSSGKGPQKSRAAGGKRGQGQSENGPESVAALY